MNTNETFTFKSRPGLVNFLIAIKTGFRDNYIGDIIDGLPLVVSSSYSVTLDMSKLYNRNDFSSAKFVREWAEKLKNF